MNKYEIQEVMESFGGELASFVAPNENFQKIELILGEMHPGLNQVDSFGRYRDLNDQFHYHLVVPCPD